MVHVIATIQLAPGAREKFLDVFRALRPQVLAEDGCLEYVPAVDVPTSIPVQEPVRHDVVTVVEKWASLDALYAHLKAPHMADYRVNVKDYVKGVRLQVLEPAG